MPNNSLNNKANIYKKGTKEKLEVITHKNSTADELHCERKNPHAQKSIKKDKIMEMERLCLSSQVAFSPGDLAANGKGENKGEQTAEGFTCISLDG